ncbi:MAG: right-handed parallel beta-helix repeat-containing protein [Acidobacteriota bacterium]|nr:right-handed parallel beta-helix repeat-containing protein [Acidobacteriota bacterium]
MDLQRYIFSFLGALLIAGSAAGQDVTVTTSSTRSAFPSKPQGTIMELTGEMRGLWMQTASVSPLTNWVSISGEVFNVKDFGAKGDDTTNDAPAIQAAINAARTVAGSGSASFGAHAMVVYFPPGVYRLGATLQLGAVNDAGPNTLELRGSAFVGARSGSILHVTDKDRDFIDVSWANGSFSIINLGFWGARTEDPLFSGTGDAIVSSALVANDGRIERNWFVDLPNAGINVTGSGTTGGLHNYHINDNAFERTAYAIKLDRGYRNEIQNNRFFANQVGIQITQGSWNHIIGNTFTQNGKSVVIKHDTASGIGPNRGNQISSNMFENGQDTDVTLTGPAGQATNTAASPNGIMATLIEDNTFDHGQRSAIQVSSATDTIISGNQMTDCNQANASYACIDVTDYSDGTVLNGNVNTVDPNTNVPRTPVGASFGANTTRNIIGINKLYGTTSPIQIPWASATQHMLVGTLVTMAPETGSCGFRFWADTASRSGAYNVNFRVKRATTPTSVTLDCTNGYRANVTTNSPFATNLTVDGFRFNITTAAAGDAYAVDCTYTVQ